MNTGGIGKSQFPQYVLFLYKYSLQQAVKSPVVCRRIADNSFVTIPFIVGAGDGSLKIVLYLFPYT